MISNENNTKVADTIKTQEYAFRFAYTAAIGFYGFLVSWFNIGLYAAFSELMVPPLAVLASSCTLAVSCYVFAELIARRLAKELFQKEEK